MPALWMSTARMPTVARAGPYRILFFSADRSEPPHVHVLRDSAAVKFWLDPVTMARNHGFSPVEVRRIRGIIVLRQRDLLEKWNGYFRQEEY